MPMSEVLDKAIADIIAKYKVANADGKMTFSEILTLVGNAVATFVQLFESFGDGTGADKKASVLAALSTFFDQVVSPIDIKGVPNFIEPVVDSAIKGLVMTFAGSSIDTIVNLLNKIGWWKPTIPANTEAVMSGLPEDFPIY